MSAVVWAFVLMKKCRHALFDHIVRIDPLGATHAYLKTLQRYGNVPVNAAGLEGASESLAHYLVRLAKKEQKKTSIGILDPDSGHMTM